MSVSDTMSFIGASTLTLPAPVPGSMKRTPQLVQNRVNSAAGGLFVDDKGVTHYRVEFDVEMTHAQAVSFDTFYRSTVQGAVNSFTWLDHENRSWAGCRFDFETGPELHRTEGKRYRLAVRLRTAVLFGT